ncbi:MAG: GDSL-type esterase/lipase family protein [Enhygromyxa sp.]
MAATLRTAARLALAGFVLVAAGSCGSGLGSGLDPRPANAAGPDDPPTASVTHTDVAGSEAGAEPEPEPAPEPGPPQLPSFTPEPGDELDPHQPLEDPSGVALDYFYRSLTDVDEGQAGAMARVLHLGDSTLGLDGIPHAIRKRMQQRFGDGGAGLLLLKRYSPSYKPASVKLSGGEGWTHCYIAYKCRGDGRYGIGGVIVSASSGAWTSFSTLPEDQPVGTGFSRAELWYAASPIGGTIAVEIDGKLARSIDSKAPDAEGVVDRWETLSVDPGPHSLKVSAAGHGKSRIYGVVLETEGPGVVWDSTSMIGAFTKRLLAWDHEHIAAQVEHRDPALIVFTYGGNDLRRIVAGTLDEDTYVEEAGAVIELVRAGKPEASCLVTSVIDHGRSGTYDVKPEHVATMVAAQRRLAAEQGCAFFDTWNAMGGANSIREWLKASPRLAEPDLKHLNHRGRELMGQWIHEALLAGYVAYRERGVDTRALADE